MFNRGFEDEGERTEPYQRLHDAVWDNQRHAHSIASRLSGLASAFAATGNERVSKTLWDMAEEIEMSAQNVCDTYSMKVSNDAQTSGVSLLNTIGAAVSVMTREADLRNKLAAATSEKSN